MGSISRVNITYLDFKKLFSDKKLNAVAADLDGHPLNEFKFQKNQIVIFGNESMGISDEIKGMVKDRVTIPRYNSNLDVESINVANSVAIVLAELKARLYSNTNEVLIKYIARRRKRLPRPPRPY